MRNANIVVYKFRPVLAKITNYRFEVIRKKEQKREKIVEKQKTKTITTKH